MKNYLITIKEYKNLVREIYVGRLILFDPLIFMNSLDETIRSVFEDHIQNNRFSEANKMLDFYIGGLRQKSDGYGMTKYYLKFTILNKNLSFCKFPSIKNLSENIEITLLDKTQYFSEVVLSNYGAKVDNQNPGNTKCENWYMNDFIKRLTNEDIMKLLNGYLKNIITLKEKQTTASINLYFKFSIFPYVSLYITKNKKALLN